MPIEISPLTEADIPGAITSIQEAFTGDPYNDWVFKDIDLTRNRVSLGIRCRWGIRNALFHVAKESGDPRVLGISMWLPPRPANQPLSWSEWARESWEDWRLWGEQVAMNAWYGRGGLNVKRYYIWKRAQEEAQRLHWTDPKGYYFCNIVTVLPSAQGKGIGRALFREVTRRADDEGISCYLESSRDEPNTKIYSALGFRMVGHMPCDDDGDVCEIHCMVRDPVKV